MDSCHDKRALDGGCRSLRFGYGLNLPVPGRGGERSKIGREAPGGRGFVGGKPGWIPVLC
jgi:hypothetical protein